MGFLNSFCTKKTGRKDGQILALLCCKNMIFLEVQQGKQEKLAFQTKDQVPLNQKQRVWQLHRLIGGYEWGAAVVATRLIKPPAPRGGNEGLRQQG